MNLKNSNLNADDVSKLASFAYHSHPDFQVALALAVEASEDSTDAAIEKLGTRGISYAIADRVINTPGHPAMDEGNHRRFP